MSDRAAAVVIGDTHIHNFRHGGPLDEHEVSLRANQVLRGMLEVAERHDPEWFIQLGDLHHVANPPPAIIGATRRVLERIAQRSKIVILAGNHDLASDRAHTLLAYQGMHNVFVVPPSCTFVGCPYVVAVAWATKQDVFRQALDQCNGAHAKRSVLVAHAAVVAGGVIADASTEASAVLLECPRDRRPTIISGHLHNFQKYNAQKVIQLGAFHGTAHGEFNVGHYMVRSQAGAWSVHRQCVPVVMNTTEETHETDLQLLASINPRCFGYFSAAVQSSPQDDRNADALQMALRSQRASMGGSVEVRWNVQMGQTALAQPDDLDLKHHDLLSAASSLLPTEIKHREEVLNLAQELAVAAQAEES